MPIAFSPSAPRSAPGFVCFVLTGDGGGETIAFPPFVPVHLPSLDPRYWFPEDPLECLIRPRRLGNTLAVRGLIPGTQAHIIPTSTSMADHMNDNEATQEKSPGLERVDPESLCSRLRDADCSSAIRTTSTAVTKAPKLKVTMRISFSLRGNLIAVRIGIGSMSRARSVMMLMGAEER